MAAHHAEAHPGRAGIYLQLQAACFPKVHSYGESIHTCIEIHMYTYIIIYKYVCMCIHV